MTDQSSQFPRFYVTATTDCPYIEGNYERKIFTELTQKNGDELHESLAKVGFRRSQDIAYRPACENCTQCLSIRLPVEYFKPSRTHKRLLKKNSDIYRKTVENIARDDHYQLLKKYLSHRHPSGGMNNMSTDEYRDMVELSPLQTQLIEYRLKEDDQLVGVALTDFMKQSLSMVYSFFDTSEILNARSLGTFIILDHIQLAVKEYLEHVYLGYWVEGSPKMNYKQNFKPFEVLSTDGWILKE